MPRFMLIVKASNDSEAGIMPSTELLDAVVAHAVPPSRLTGRQPAGASSAPAVSGVRRECGTSAVRAAAGGGSKRMRNTDMIPSIRAD